MLFRSSAVNKTAEKAMELLLRLEPKPAEQRQPLPVRAAELAKYAGVYSQPGVMRELVVKDGKLYLKQGKADVPVTKVGENRFSAGALAAQELIFIPGRDGRIAYLHSGGRAFGKAQ